MSITCGDGTTVELAPRHHAMVNRRLDAEADQLEPAIVMVRRHWKSGREDVLKQLLALMKGEVHQEVVTA